MQLVEPGNEYPLHRCVFGHAEFDEVVPREQLFDTLRAWGPAVDEVRANTAANLREALGAAGRQRLVDVPRSTATCAGRAHRSVPPTPAAPRCSKRCRTCGACGRCREAGPAVSLFGDLAVAG